MSELDKKFNIVDEVTPPNEFLSAHYKRGFAFFTIKERLPIILTKVIDNLSREKEKLINEYGEKSQEDLKDIIGNISKLKYELQTDKPFKLLEGDNDSDQAAWNDFIEHLDEGRRSYFSAIWLHAECYLYRRLKSLFVDSVTLKAFDYFRKQKEESFISNVPAFIELATQMTEIRQCPTEDVRKYFDQLMKVNLWGNRVDLSISAGTNVTQNINPFAMIANLEDKILANDLDAIWDALKADSNATTIDLIHDNAGYELFTDLILIDFLLTHNLAERIRCHVKMIPWFVSDVMPSDFQWTLQQLNESDNLELRGFGMRLSEYVSDKRLTYAGDYFWTSGYDYNQMECTATELFANLRPTKLAIFKGDLNYRKLMGDLNWPPTTPFPDALRGFRKMPVCALRTVKADTISGLTAGTFETLNERDIHWMETGEFGLIQYAPPKID